MLKRGLRSLSGLLRTKTTALLSNRFTIFIEVLIVKVILFAQEP